MKAPDRADVVFTFREEMLEDAIAREFNWPTDQTLAAIARDERVRILLAADGWRSYPISLARLRPSGLVQNTALLGRTVVRVRPHRLRRRDSTDSSTIARSYERYGRLLGVALARARGEREASGASATLVTYNPFLAAYCEEPWVSHVIYCGQDDWATGGDLQPWWHAYREAYRRIDARGATIFAVSAELAGRISPRARVVPNGVSPETWRPRHAAPARIAALQRPRAVYTGTVEGRLDLDLVKITAETVGSLIMIGSYPDRAVTEQLKSIPSVHLFDRVQQTELAATVQACDLGVIPHRDRAGIRAMSPIKLYEYLAGGLPVLTVDLPPVRGVDDERVIVSSTDKWSEGISCALDLGPADENRRLRFIDEAAWSRRMQPIVDTAVSATT